MLFLHISVDCEGNYQDLLEGCVVESSIMRQVMDIGNDIRDLHESSLEIVDLVLQYQKSLLGRFRVMTQFLSNLVNLPFHRSYSATYFTRFDLSSLHVVIKHTFWNV